MIFHEAAQLTGKKRRLVLYDKPFSLFSIFPNSTITNHIPTRKALIEWKNKKKTKVRY